MVKTSSLKHARHDQDDPQVESFGRMVGRWISFSMDAFVVLAMVVFTAIGIWSAITFIMDVIFSNG